MRSNKIKELIAAKSHVINAWCSLPCSYAAEIVAQQGYDSITIDLQHGAMHFETAFSMLQAVASTPAMPMVRVPWNEPALIMKLLDAGALGVICPMVNSREDADRFVRACRFPPDGIRSYGPGRVVYDLGATSGADYAAHANDSIVTFAQIETTQGLNQLHEILEAPGLDGIYVGPGDLSLALGVRPSMNPTDEIVVRSINTILDAVLDRGLIACIHTDGPKTARQRFVQGFHLCSLQNDVRLLTDGARKQVLAVRPSQ